MRVVLHAPTSAALDRARKNAANLKREASGLEVRIVANSEAVSRALDAPHEELDSLTWVCPNTLALMGRDNRPPLQVLPVGAILEILHMQQAGWLYIRA